jgi:hypothetical protein
MYMVETCADSIGMPDFTFKSHQIGAMPMVYADSMLVH